MEVEVGDLDLEVEIETATPDLKINAVLLCLQNGGPYTLRELHRCVVELVPASEKSIGAILRELKALGVVEIRRNRWAISESALQPGLPVPQAP